MAEQYYNTQNVLNLPKVETINATDYLIVQDANNNTQTSLLQFQNFVIGLDNVTFGETLTTHTNDIFDLNIKTDKLSSLLSSTKEEIYTLSSYVDDTIVNDMMGDTNELTVDVGESKKTLVNSCNSLQDQLSNILSTISTSKLNEIETIQDDIANIKKFLSDMLTDLAAPSTITVTTLSTTFKNYNGKKIDYDIIG